MRSSTVKPIILFILTVVVFYLAAFYGIEFLMRRKGPWQVQFLTDAKGVPSLRVRQPRLHIADVQLLCAGTNLLRTNLNVTVLFDQPLKPVPFGKVIYEDLTQMPGVVTFNLFGHEVELLPRTLLLDKKEVGWQSNMSVTLGNSTQSRTP